MASNSEEPKVGEGRKVIDDAQLKKMLAADKPGFFKSNQYRILTLSLIAINIIVYIIEVAASGLGFSISSKVLISMGAMYAPLIQSASDLYRFITPMFLHVDLMHLAFNMVALFSVGGMLERVLGKGNFLLLYFISGITGNAVSYISSVYFMTGMTVSAGASTSVFGLFVAVALLGILHKGDRNYFAQYSKSMISIIAINIVYTFLVPSISISGHLGGALGGLIAMLMIPSKNLRVPAVVRVIVAIAWVGALIYLFIDQGLIGI